MRRRITAKLLALAESLYLTAHGWRHDKHGWAAPYDHPSGKPMSYRYTRAHAVNSVRYYERESRFPHAQVWKTQEDFEDLLRASVEKAKAFRKERGN